MKPLYKTLIALCASLSLTGCVSILGDHVRFTEEVKLSDGKVVVIQRHAELTASGFPSQRRGFVKYFEICYPPMNIHWKSKGGYEPDIFDIVDGKAYMHVPISGCRICAFYNNPPTSALYFVWENGTWKRIPHEEFPAQSEWNLLRQTTGGVSRSDDPRGLITLADKTTGKWIDSDLRYSQQYHGWRRVNEDPDYVRNSCKEWNCNYTYPDATGELDLFVDNVNTCKR